PESAASPFRILMARSRPRYRAARIQNGNAVHRYALCVHSQPLSTERSREAAVPRIATTTSVDRDRLVEFVRPRHHLVLMTTKADGSPQASPVTGGVDEQGRIV